MVSMIEMFGQGWAVGEGIAASRDRTRAKQAAIEKYGNVARDPGLFTAIQDVQFGAAREGREVAQEGRAAAQEQRAAETFDIAKRDTGQAKQQQAVLGMVNGLRAARDRGEDVGAAFDNIVDTLPSLGVNPDDIPGMRQAVVDNPAVLDDYLAALGGGAAPAKAADLSEKEQARAIMNDPSATEPDKTWAASIMGGKGGAGAAGGVAGQAFSDILNRIDILEGSDEEFVEGVGGPEEFQRVQESIFGTPTLKGARAGGYGSFGSVTGTRAANYVANFDALAGDIRSVAFETLKGGGAITEKESEFAASAISRLTRSTSPDEYRRELKRLRAYMENLAGVAARRQEGETVPEQLTYPPEAASDDMSELARRILADPDAAPEDRQWAESVTGGQ